MQYRGERLIQAAPGELKVAFLNVRQRDLTEVSYIVKGKKNAKNRQPVRR